MTTLQIEKLDAALGARIAGVDLREPLEPGLVDALRDALFDHQVLFFRDQPLSDDQHLDVARAFGRPNVYPLVEMLGSDKPLEIVADGPNQKPVASSWHTDVTWLPDPPKIGILSAQVIPERGGDTLWCSLYSVYDSLPPEKLAAIRDLEIAHAPGEGFVQLVVNRFGDDFRARFRARYGEGTTHPLVREHPVTGRPLIWLSGGFMDGVVDMEREAGRALLGELMALADDPVHQVRWPWQPHDLAIWDERSTMHRVDSNHWPAPRVMRRCTID